MKILWITNTPLEVLGENIYGKRSNGLWMSALLHDFIQANEHRLVVATSVAVQEIIRLEENGVVYYGIPNQVPLLYNENEKNNSLAWKEIIDGEQPDLIQIWGTEFTHGLCALRVAGDIPSVIYMQGYLQSIARHYLAGMTNSELKASITFRDFIKRDSIFQQQQKYFASIEKEKEIFERSGKIICENDWCENSVKALNPGIESFRCPLSINTIFFEKKWSIEQAEPHSIICTASGYPLKGLHMVLRAVALLKNRYSDIKLYVPGPKMVADASLQWMIRKRGYMKYIEKLIKKLDIEENIVWLGMISQEQLAEQYAKTRVFVLSSAIENHASSLKEAMMVGTPSIAAFVGGIPEYVQHGENGFLYRFEEYEIMAEYIKKLFEEDSTAVKISENGRKDMYYLHSRNNVYKTICDIYKKITEGKE
ncbi:MAG: glycosyltransferase [[Ruminococcus] gnavus]|nr:glycosyltransferase [Mediterraneibacter gnavus]